MARWLRNLRLRRNCTLLVAVLVMLAGRSSAIFRTDGGQESTARSGEAKLFRQNGPQLT